MQSPGLWAVAAGLADLGEIVISAPREQASGTGRSVPVTSDGRIERIHLPIDGHDFLAYAVGGTPAQAVLHAVLEFLPRRPDLVVSGINYGENVGSGVTISGTVGAALEAAALGIPALAVSLQVAQRTVLRLPRFGLFHRGAHHPPDCPNCVVRPLPEDVDVLKIEVPAHASPHTPWRMTRQARHRYYVPYPIRQGELNEPGSISASIRVQPGDVPPTPMS